MGVQMQQAYHCPGADDAAHRPYAAKDSGLAQTSVDNPMQAHKAAQAARQGALTKQSQRQQQAMNKLLAKLQSIEDAKQLQEERARKRADAKALFVQRQWDAAITIQCMVRMQQSRARVLKRRASGAKLVAWWKVSKLQRIMRQAAKHSRVLQMSYMVGDLAESVVATATAHVDSLARARVLMVKGAARRVQGFIKDFGKYRRRRIIQASCKLRRAIRRWVRRGKRRKQIREFTGAQFGRALPHGRRRTTQVAQHAQAGLLLYNRKLQDGRKPSATGGGVARAPQSRRTSQAGDLAAAPRVASAGGTSAERLRAAVAGARNPPRRSSAPDHKPEPMQAIDEKERQFLLGSLEPQMDPTAERALRRALVEQDKARRAQAAAAKEQAELAERLKAEEVKSRIAEEERLQREAAREYAKKRAAREAAEARRKAVEEELARVKRDEENTRKAEEDAREAEARRRRGQAIREAKRRQQEELQRQKNEMEGMRREELRQRAYELQMTTKQRVTRRRKQSQAGAAAASPAATPQRDSRKTSTTLPQLSPAVTPARSGPSRPDSVASSQARSSAAQGKPRLPSQAKALAPAAPPAVTQQRATTTTSRSTASQARNPSTSSKPSKTVQLPPPVQATVAVQQASVRNSQEDFTEDFMELSRSGDIVATVLGVPIPAPAPPDPGPARAPGGADRSGLVSAVALQLASLAETSRPSEKKRSTLHLSTVRKETGANKAPLFDTAMVSTSPPSAPLSSETWADALPVISVQSTGHPLVQELLPLSPAGSDAFPDDFTDVGDSTDLGL